MPLIPIDYSKTIIYKIQHKEKKELFYIGHTTNFDSRKYQHLNSCTSGRSKKSYNSMLYIMIRAHGDWKMFDMVPIKQVECKNRIEALIEEQKSIDELQSTMNFVVAHKKTATSDPKVRYYKQLPT